MLNRTKQLNKLCFSSCLVIGFILLTSTAKAQFIGINVDAAIAYSAAPGSVSGGSVGITHPVPYFPNLGVSKLSFIEKQTKTSSSSNTLSLVTDTKIETVNFFYNIPFPVVSIALGIGTGTMKTDTAVTETSSSSSNSSSSNSDDSDLSTPVSEGFIHIGLPFWNIIEFHIGYHAMSVSKIDLTSKSGISVTDYSLEKKNYTGGMTTIGVQIAF